jgi:hypothetical protein
VARRRGVVRLGRPAVADEPPVLRVPETAEAVEAMPWADMKALFASWFVDEIGAVIREVATHTFVAE